MKKYHFYEGVLPPDIVKAYEPPLYQWQAFRFLHDPGAWMSFYLIDDKKKIALAEIHFFLDAGQAISPFRAPFGSFDFCATLQPQVLNEFVCDVEKGLVNAGVTGMTIKNPPLGYAPESLSLLETIMFNNGYHVVSSELSTLIPVTQAPFVSRIRVSERLRIRQALERGCVLRLLPLQRLGDVYRFLSAHHGGKGYTTSVTLAEFERTVALCPERFLLFVVVLDEKIIAASISIRFQEGKLYNFFANHDPAFNQISPMVLLLDGLYECCRQNGMTLLDLGTSALNGKPNYPLLDFKMRVGGIPSSKLTFHKKVR